MNEEFTEQDDNSSYHGVRTTIILRLFFFNLLELFKLKI